ncbi:BRO family protein [Thalassobius sp. Cn5-15]|uniref:BRO-N domain-containing protein n=1 Tax=Thalassobius sp. Cn5-15 TaxID=2917763 RepID=UPI001EF313F5|nr:BRO family protein [Thalassobius sp. Cn5-15]MCG7494715.1 hypothetical protein [Thalassobius sp. Cn5-15]
MKNLNTAPAGDTAVSTFNFSGFDLRCFDSEGEPWFFVPEICRVLGMTLISGTTQWTKSLSANEKHHITKKEHPDFFSGSCWHAILVSESGLYRMVMRSNKPEAKEFQDWVTRDVLPAIRKDGGYVENEEKVATGEMDEDELIHRKIPVSGGLGIPFHLLVFNDLRYF